MSTTDEPVAARQYAKTIVAGLTFYAVSKAGFLLGRMAQKEWPSLHPYVGDVPTLAFVVVLSAGLGILNIFHPLLEVFHGKPWRSCCWQPAVGLFAAFFAYGLSQLPPPQPPPTILDLGAFAVSELGDDGALASFWIPYSREAHLLPEPVGVKVEPFAEPLVKGLASALSKCNARTGETAAIEIRAFASSSGTEEANLTVIKRRAEEIKIMFNDNNPKNALGQSTEVEVKTSGWSVREMTRNQVFGDRFVTYDETVAFLTRHAEIRIMKAGTCKLSPPVLSQK